MVIFHSYVSLPEGTSQNPKTTHIPDPYATVPLFIHMLMGTPDSLERSLLHGTCMQTGGAIPISMWKSHRKTMHKWGIVHWQIRIAKPIDCHHIPSTCDWNPITSGLSSGALLVIEAFPLLCHFGGLRHNRAFVQTRHNMRWWVQGPQQVRGDNIDYSIWLVVSTPLKSMSSSVGIIIPNIWGNSIHVPNHHSV